MGEMSWVNIPGLEQAASWLEEEARKQHRIVSEIFSEALNLLDPEMFGDDKAARKFFEKWRSDLTDWVEGTNGFADGTWATAAGVHTMADIYRNAAKAAEDMAETAGTVVNQSVPDGFANPSVPPPATLPATSPDNGDGSTGGNHNGRR